MYVIGTAGHVDHGKSTLVRALTGIDPDRLAEEKAREMTIDLGFAWLKLASLPDEVGVVDVPGHRDFIENMLAGVGGIDLALFVVAADEGVMPQTKEHLAILDLLAIRGGVVALTKTDMIDDPEWLDLVSLDVAEALQGTVLADAPIVPVSARTGAGLKELKKILSERLQQVEPREDRGRARLSVDRVFTLSGFGTIVTGTLIGGSFQVGEAIEVQPAGLKGRIRGLQSHKTKLETARPGSRVAINLTGIDKDDIRRGDVVAAANVVRSTILCDVSYRHLPDAAAPLHHNAEVKLFVGAKEVLARARVLGTAEIKPGEEGWLQLVLRQPAAIVRGDHFILRRPSPGATIGGGLILDPHPGKQHRRFRPEVISRLQTLSQGTPAELLLQTLMRLEPIPAAKLLKQAGMDAAAAQEALTECEQEKLVVRLDEQLVSQATVRRWLGQMEQVVRQYHREYPLRLGISREEVRSRLKLSAAVFNPLIRDAAANGLLVEANALLYLPGHTIQFSPAQQGKVDRLMALFQQGGINSPSIKECQELAGEDVYFALVDLGELQPVNESVVYAAADYHRFIHIILDYLRQHGKINAAQVRDLFNTSRKYAIALLEHLDGKRLTRREGDDRVLFD
jgi:selenocysteine-specific elongation factor